MVLASRPADDKYVLKNYKLLLKKILYSRHHILDTKTQDFVAVNI